LQNEPILPEDPFGVQSQQNADERAHINVGMARTLFFGPDPAYSEWKRNSGLAPSTLAESHSNSGNANYIRVNIPIEWSNFFTMLLMSSGSFDATKAFLSSKAMQHVDSKMGTIYLSIPPTCPVSDSDGCYC